MPAPSWRMKPARTSSLCEATCASAGASLRVGTKAWLRRTGRIWVPGYTLDAVSPRTRNALLAAAVLVIAAGSAWDAGLFRAAPPPLRPTPDALALGERILASRCLHCHAAIPLAPR